MNDFSKMTIKELLRPEGYACSCGRTHTTELREFQLGAGVIRELPAALARMGCKKPFVVSDENTDRVAGVQVRKLLDENNISYASHVFPPRAGHLEPDEYAVGAICMAFDPTCDVVLAVGSGVINDCCKVLAHTAHLPSLVVGTAPSMDGYASDSSSMVQDRTKTTLYNACPITIIADTDILATAPEIMLKAGLGDMLAKYISICEWRISHWVTGEYYCENIAGLMRASLNKIRESAQGLLQRDKAAIEGVMEGLTLSGIAMSFAKISRPASGLEHYFSHLWEMKALQGECPSGLHGVQVGVGTCLTLKLFDRLRTLVPDREKALNKVAAYSQEEWEKQMYTLFSEDVARGVIELENEIHKNDAQKHAQRLEQILLRWDDIQRLMAEELPTCDEIVSLMEELRMDTTPEELGLSRKDTLDAFFGAREIRDKYMTSSILWDLGVLEEFAQLL